MLKLNFLLVLRQLKKDKKSFLINLIGSSIGFTAIILMILYISFEDNYDGFNENSDRLFRIERTVNDKVQSQTFDSTPYELAEELKTSFPEVVDAASVRSTSNYLSVSNELFPQREGLYADNNFLSMFSFEFLKGDKSNALVQPMTIVLSASLANVLFPNGDALGKTVRVNKKDIVTVKGVFKDYPKDAHMKMDYILSYNSFENLYGMNRQRGWDTSYTTTYVLINDQEAIGHLGKKIENLLASHVTLEDGNSELLSIRPITDIYLKTLDVRSSAMGGPRNDVMVIYLFLAVALFTAFITTVNYINLTTTQLLNRELEIGIKKVLGISKKQLRYQFIFESLFMVLGVLIVSSIFIYLILPVFSLLVDRDFSSVFEGNWMLILKLIVGVVIIGILGGLYPVFYLSSLKINSFLQGNTSIKRRGLLRKGLVLFQLLIAIPLIFLSVFIISQINYLNNKDVGFEKENLMLAWVNTPTIQDRERLDVMENRLLQNPNVSSFSISRGAPFFSSGREEQMNWEGSTSSDKIRFSTYTVDDNFLDTYEMTLKNGRWFSEAFSTDNQSACVINETAARLLGWPDPIGKTIDNGRLQVIGVVKDFNQFSLFQKIPPMVLTMNEKKTDYSLVSLKVNPIDRHETLASVNNLFNTNFIDTPILFRFLDEGFDEGYMTALENVMRIFILFSVISILLVIIGLYSLIAFSLRMQKKMIAIRKVMGASTKGLFNFIMKEYLILYGIAITISLIVTYFVVVQVSQAFAYSVGIKMMNFLVVILITLVIVLLTVSGKIWSASRKNPIEAINRP